MEPFDFFAHYEYLSPEALAVYDEFADGDNTYESCNQLLSEMNAVGYTFDYYLNAEPYELRPIGFENIQMQVHRGTAVFYDNGDRVLFERAVFILNNYLLNEGFEVSQCFAHPKGFVFKIDNLPHLEFPYTALLNMDDGELTGVPFSEAINYVIDNGIEY